MNQDQFKGAWHQLKGEAKRQWGQLTDDDLTTIDGNSEKLVGLVQQKYGYARERAEQEVHRFAERAARDTRTH
jgi:uncharacterized protein YjbJ (UPF0337 family)